MEAVEKFFSLQSKIDRHDLDLYNMIRFLTNLTEEEKIKLLDTLDVDEVIVYYRRLMKRCYEIISWFTSPEAPELDQEKLIQEYFPELYPVFLQVKQYVPRHLYLLLLDQILLCACEVP